jgi:hypothetical protein
LAPYKSLPMTEWEAGQAKICYLLWIYQDLASCQLVVNQQVIFKVLKFTDHKFRRNGEPLEGEQQFMLHLLFKNLKRYMFIEGLNKRHE